jgi:D-alanine transaminase
MRPVKPVCEGGERMSRIVYVNGVYVAEEAARISVFDRGFLFADGVYEVTSVLEGRLLDFGGHMARLRRSLGELEMAAPCEEATLEAIHRELVSRNVLTEGLIYLQVTRGAADRDFIFPPEAVPSLVMFTQAKALRAAPAARTGLRIISVPDIRWARRDIKTVQLLAPSLCKMAAKKAGKDDAWMVEDGLVTEGTSNNAYIVTRDGTIVTRDLSNAILHGITRAAVLRYAREAQMKVEERAFSIEEATDAAEAFVTSASSFVLSVVEIDSIPVGSGAPGPVTRRLREIYIEEGLKAAR